MGFTITKIVQAMSFAFCGPSLIRTLLRENTLSSVASEHVHKTLSVCKNGSIVKKATAFSYFGRKLVATQYCVSRLGFIWAPSLFHGNDRQSIAGAEMISWHPINLRPPSVKLPSQIETTIFAGPVGRPPRRPWGFRRRRRSGVTPVHGVAGAAHVQAADNDEDESNFRRSPVANWLRNWVASSEN